MFLPRKKLLFDSLKQVVSFTNVNYSNAPEIAKSSEASPISKGKPKKEPFLKNIFAGRFDDAFLQISGPRKDLSPKVLELLDKFDLSSINCENEQQNVNKLRILAKNGFFKLKLADNYGGIDVTNCELVQIYERLNLDPSLALLLELQNSYVIPSLLHHGSVEQKEHYLKKLLEGEITGAFAVSEKKSGSDPFSVNSSVNEDSGSFVLNGEKIWVTNACNADFFIVFAKTTIDNLRTRTGENVQELSAFLVDKCDSMNIEYHNLFGLKDISSGKLVFKNLTLPKHTVIGALGEGTQVAVESLKSHKFITVVSFINALKKLLADVTLHINERKQFPRDLKQCDLIKKRVADICCVIYCLESMLYFISDISDKYEIDTSLEYAFLNLYSLKRGFEMVSESMDLLGSKSFDCSFPYEKMWRDLKGFTIFSTPIIIELFTSLMGLDYAGKVLRDVVMKNRNPFNFPVYTLKKLISSQKQKSDNPKLTLKLYLNLHPSLKQSSEQLEYCLLRLQYAVETLFLQHGNEIVNRQIALQQLSIIAMEIFAMTSVLSRSSYSYCTGVQHCDQEINLTRLICYNSFSRVKNLVKDMLDSDNMQRDYVTLDLGSYVLNRQSYFIEHPMKHDI